MNQNTTLETLIPTFKVMSMIAWLEAYYPEVELPHNGKKLYAGWLRGSNSS
jgi:hypothetical protein